MSNKVRLISTISAICMVLALLTVGVWAVSTASVTLGGSVSFTADNIHAKITGSVTGTQETISLAELNYSADTTPSEDNINTWANNQMTFTSENLITMTITVENLSEERSLFVTLADNTTTTNVGKTLKQGASNYTSATAVEVSAKGTTTFTMTLSVTDTNKSASATVAYQVDLRDANAEVVEAVELDSENKAGSLTYTLDTSNKTATVSSYDRSVANVEIPSVVSKGGVLYTVTAVGDNAFKGDSYFYYETTNYLQEVVIPNTIISIGDNAFANNGLNDIVIPDSVQTIGECAFTNYSLMHVTIGSGVKNIGSNAFASDNNLYVTTHAITPPTIVGGSIAGVFSCPDGATIYVPAESLEAYKSAWTDDRLTIQAIS